MENKHNFNPSASSLKPEASGFSQMKTKDLLELKKRLSYIVDHLDPFAPGTLNPTMRHALAEFDLEKELNDPFGFTHKTLVWFDLMDTELKSRQYFEND